MTPTNATSTYDRRTAVAVLLNPEDTGGVTVTMPVLSAWDVEAALSHDYPAIIVGSLRFLPLKSTDPQVVALFRIALTDGSIMRGHVRVNPRVENDKIGIEVRVTRKRAIITT